MTGNFPTLPRFCALNNVYSVFCDLDPSFVGNEMLRLRSSCLPASLKRLLTFGGGPGTRSGLGASRCGSFREWYEPKRQSYLQGDYSNGLWKRRVWGRRRTGWHPPCHQAGFSVCIFLLWFVQVWMFPFLFFPLVLCTLCGLGCCCWWRWPVTTYEEDNPWGPHAKAALSS